MRYTVQTIKDQQAALNGSDFVDSVPEKVFEATVHYMDLCDYNQFDEESEGVAMTAFDVLRLANDGEFDL